MGQSNYNMDYKRYIFLDVDGVLNHPAWYEKNREKHLSYKEYEHIVRHLDPEKIDLLNQLEGCEVVLSTSWDHDECIANMPGCGLKLPIIGGIKCFELYRKYMVRGNSIAEWFVEQYGDMPRDSFFDSFEKTGWWHPHSRYIVENGVGRVVFQDNLAISYVIFDDNADMLMDQKNHFIHVDSSIGLTQENINQAKQILNIK